MTQTVTSYARFIDLLSRSERAVLEYPQHWERSKRLFDLVLSILHPRIVYECVMDLSHNSIKSLDPGIAVQRLVRRLVVLDRMEPVANLGEIRSKVARALYGSGAEAVLARGRESFASTPDALRLQDAQLAFDKAVCQVRSAGELYVRTSNEPWSYAAYVPFRRMLPSHGAALICVKGRVEKGTLAVGALKADDSEVIGERFLTARPDAIQETEIFLPDVAAAKGFLCRNGQVAGVSEGVLLDLELLVRSPD